MHLSTFMQSKNLNDDQVAEAIGVSRVTVSRIRRRKVRPEWSTIQSLRIFTKGDVTADDFEMLESKGLALKSRRNSNK
jgi:transcriptional regulator with XRE-family HTH domain